MRAHPGRSRGRDGFSRLALRNLGLEPLQGRLPVAHLGARLRECEPEDDREHREREA